jgi:diaminopimelate decarboxylase
MNAKYKSGDKYRIICGTDMVQIGDKYGTPLYVLFEEILCENFSRFRDTFGQLYGNHLICYAVKANNALAVVKLFADLGAGADVASEFEMLLALEAGIPAEKIRANGNCKSRYYLEECIKRGIVINVDPEDELETIDEISGRTGVKAKINIRLAGFPLKNVTSPAITTSSEWSKFGISIQQAEEVFSRASAMENLMPNGLMVHIGSQITDAGAYYLVLDELLKLSCQAKDIGFEVNEIDLGGGYGISYLNRDVWESAKRRIAGRENGFTWANEAIGYNSSMEWTSEELFCPFTPDLFIHDLLRKSYSGDRTFAERLKDIGSPRLVVEPGRSLVGDGGVTLVRVCQTSKMPSGQDLVHVNAGVNHHSMSLIIPEQMHEIEIANRIASRERFEAFVAGNLCFTGDLFGRVKTKLNSKPKRGDFLILYDTGAYSDFFVSNTNSFPRPAKVLVGADGKERLLVKREEPDEMFQRDLDWRKNPGHQ